MPSAAFSVRRTVRHMGLGFALTAGLTIGTSARADDGSGLDVEFEGLIDFRGAVSSATQSWENGGLGKTRYGGGSDGDRRVLGNIAEASLVIEPHFTWDLSGVIQITADPEEHTAPDLIEAYVQYKPAPQGPVGVRVKAGAFFPPISLENTGLAWTSPYTISPSAIDTWVGEELRTIGGEASVFYRNDDVEVSLTGSVFGNDDAAGTLLAWRGWTISDRKIGLFDQLNLAKIPIIQPNAILSKQLPYDEPFREIDQRVGYYAGATVKSPDYGMLTLLRYDNRADNRAFQGGQWAWHTSFWSAGASIPVGGLEFLVQGMTGATTLINTPIGPIVYADFKAAYALVSHAWDKQRVSFRVDWFRNGDEDVFPDNNNEHGYGLTAAYIYRPTPKQRITLEMLYIDSVRPEREQIGLPARARESQFQISYRFFL